MSSEQFAELQSRWFRRLAVGVAITCVLFAAALGGLGLVLHINLLLLGAGILGALSAVSLIALFAAARKQLLVGAQLLSGAGVAHAIVQSYLFPFAAPALAVSIVLSVASVLPYVTGRPLRWLVGASALSSLAAAVLAQLSPLAAAVPAGAQRALEVAALPAATILTALILLEYSERIRFTRDAERDARLEVEQARSALEDTSSRLAVALAAARIGIWDVDLATGTLTSDARCKALFGLAPGGELAYSSFLERVHSDHRERVRQAVEGALAGENAGRYVVEYRSLGLDGVERWIRSTGQAVFAEHRPVRLIGTVEDVTTAKVDEADLRTAKNKAEEASRAKDDFLAMLGHELRNPLAPILTALELLRIRIGDAGARERDIIQRQVHNLVQLVDDLLDVSRLRAGKISVDLHPLYVRQIVSRALESVSGMLEQRRHHLEVDIQPPDVLVLGDEHRLVQVITNLLTNAIKYTDAGGAIGLTVRADDHDLVLRVRDSGRGMPAALVPRVFDVFVQGERTPDRSEGGLGLGLTIVRSIVERHGGKVSAFSAGPGRGSEFVVTLPAAAAATPLPMVTPPPDDDRDAHGSQRVLVVDDNQDAAESLCELLADNGYACRLALDGPGGLAAVREFDPDIVLLDLGLPKLDGYEVARRIRAMPRGIERVLIAVTGYGEEQDRSRSAQAGFAAHLVKPVDLDKLLTVIRAVSPALGAQATFGSA
jgi:signal transduction histidine kinase/ActR/RegA family two-component response regulator